VVGWDDDVDDVDAEEEGGGGEDDEVSDTDEEREDEEEEVGANSSGDGGASGSPCCVSRETFFRAKDVCSDLLAKVLCALTTGQVAGRKKEINSDVNAIVRPGSMSEC
jgi:hypothetical protein